MRGFYSPCPLGEDGHSKDMESFIDFNVKNNGYDRDQMLAYAKEGMSPQDVLILAKEGAATTGTISTATPVPSNKREEANKVYDSTLSDAVDNLDVILSEREDIYLGKGYERSYTYREGDRGDRLERAYINYMAKNKEQILEEFCENNPSSLDDYDGESIAEEAIYNGFSGWRKSMDPEASDKSKNNLWQFLDNTAPGGPHREAPMDTDKPLTDSAAEWIRNTEYNDHNYAEPPNVAKLIYDDPEYRKGMKWETSEFPVDGEREQSSAYFTYKGAEVSLEAKRSMGYMEVTYRNGKRRRYVFEEMRDGREFESNVTSVLDDIDKAEPPHLKALRQESYGKTTTPSRKPEA